MKTKTLLFSALVFLTSVTVGQNTIHVPGDYPSIQAGIDAASNGDTVLVDSGIYFENISINHERRITVASRYLITNDRSYIYNTIIDGNQSGSTVSYESCSYDSIDKYPQVLCGFTIQNGSGGCIGEGPQPTRGGGIRCERARNTLLNNLIVHNNDGKDYGGGIYIGHSDTVYLKDVTIRNNKAAHGGGICGYVIFDTLELCNVYSNQAIVGADFYNGFYSNTNNVCLDTFSVSNPTGFYASPIDNFIFQVNSGLIEQVDADLFVSPDGDNNNSGLSEQSPLKSINYAFSKLKADSLSPRTVYLLEGVYQLESDNIFPVCIPQYASLIGINKNDVILDGGGENVINPDFEGYNSVIVFSGNSNSLLSDLSVTGGSGSPCLEGSSLGGGIYCSNSSPVMQDLIISENTGDLGGGIYIFNHIQGIPKIERCLIRHNNAKWGGGITIRGDWWTDPAKTYIINTVVDSNYSDSTHGWAGGGGVYCEYSNPSFINSTIVNNLAIGGTEGGGIVSLGSNIELVNSILWNNQPQEILTSDHTDNSITISYTNLEGGLNGIELNGNNDTITWLDGNINQEPLFTGSGDHPYSLQGGSPCIDKGITDTSGLLLGMYDFPGNLRCWDGDQDGDAIIDMGAYEFGSVGFGDFETPVKNQQIVIKLYPNPASSTISINLMPDTEATSVDIINIQGQVVLNEQIVDNGLSCNIASFPNGIYIVHVHSNEGIGVGKFIKQ